MKGFLFNKVYVIESLKETEEKLTGEELFKDLLRWKEYQIKDFKSELIQVKNKKDFLDKMDYVRQECITKEQYPILHFEIHGSNERTGLILESGELISWHELNKFLIEINSIVGNNLFITMAVCYGAYIMELIQPNSPSPFWGIIGSFQKIDESDLRIRYNEFYDTFLKDFDLDLALDMLNNSNPNIPSSYRLINSEAVFKNVMQKYFEKEFTDEEISKSCQRFSEKMGIKINRNVKRSLERKLKSELLRTRKEYFEKYKRVFFMLNKFPENKDRFKIQIQEVERFN